MVRVTDEAAVALKELLVDNDAPPDAGVRITPTAEGQVGMVIDSPREGDEVIRRDETPVLIVGDDIAPRMTDMVVDFETPRENGTSPGGFVLRSS
jgi:Fe-S cluster assembly iron-binding protein IscA